jgi:hypothetical protein
MNLSELRQKQKKSEPKIKWKRMLEEGISSAVPEGSGGAEADHEPSLKKQ